MVAVARVEVVEPGADGLTPDVTLDVTPDVTPDVTLDVEPGDELDVAAHPRDVRDPMSDPGAGADVEHAVSCAAAAASASMARVGRGAIMEPRSPTGRR